jgi:MFS family permease
MNSFASVGKIISPPLVSYSLERWGHRRTLIIMAILNYIGGETLRYSMLILAILEITSNTVAQFIVGRCVVYVG